MTPTHTPKILHRLIGMSLMYVLQLGGAFQWTVRQCADVENEIVSVERVNEYCMLPAEAALDSEPGHSPPPSWPAKGAIVAQNLQVAYRPGLPLVLKGLNFRIEGGMRVAIVGRTG
jgi:ABC-type multidrug transport system fused ATPase/permease subunit